MNTLGQLALIAIRQLNRSKFKLKRKSWTGHGCTIAYLEAGAGNSHEPLVFLHGLGASKDQWGAHIYDLARDYHCFFVDLPGEGESSFEASASYSPAQQMLRLTQFLDAIRVDRCILIGSSIGGCIAGLFAKDHPDKVSRLILMAPAGIQAISPSEVISTFVASGRHPFGYRSEAEMFSFWQLVFSRPPTVPALLSKALAHKGLKRFKRINKIVDDFHSTGLRQLEQSLQGINSDTLFLWGEQDKIFDVSCLKVVCSLKPDSSVEVISGAGHALYLDSGAKTVHVMKKFIMGKDSLLKNQTPALT